MKKKFLLTLVGLVCALSCMFGLAACNNGEHEHVFGYGYDDIQHWTHCWVPGCREQTPNENHNYVDGICVCGSTPLVYFLTDDGNYAFVSGLYDDAVEAGVATIESIVVLAEYEGKPVTEIKDYAFANKSEIMSITLPATITKIGSNVFQNCTNLTTIIYKGTKAQWNAITKPDNDGWWRTDDSVVNNYTIRCTDGNITKEN